MYITYQKMNVFGRYCIILKPIVLVDLVLYLVVAEPRELLSVALKHVRHGLTTDSV